MVRIASTDDAPTIAGLLDAFNVEFGAETPGSVVLERRLRVLLANGQTFAVLAGVPTCAFALVTVRPSVWTEGVVAVLDELYTSPDRRNQGIGSAILTAAVDEARRIGATEMQIEVDEPDTDAHRFYARHGFPMRDATTGDRAFVLRNVLDAESPGSDRIDRVVMRAISDDPIAALKGKHANRGPSVDAARATERREARGRERS